MDVVHIDPARVLLAAHDLADAGVPVFPCVPGQKRPLTAHGLLDATTDVAQIRRWWNRTPTANLAVPTGPRTMDVLDVDHRPAGSGFAPFHALAEAGLLAGYTQVVTTPSGGIHVYFAGSHQSSARLPELFLDFKAAGGYILVPPSVVEGRPYAFVRRSPDPAASLNWADVRALLVPPASSLAQHSATSRLLPNSGRHRGRDPLQVLAAWVAALPEGRRNDGTYWAACRAAEGGFTDLRPIVRAAVAAGLSDLEARSTVRSALRRFNQAGQPSPTAVRSQPRGRR